MKPFWLVIHEINITWQLVNLERELNSQIVVRVERIRERKAYFMSGFWVLSLLKYSMSNLCCKESNALGSFFVKTKSICHEHFSV